MRLLRILCAVLAITPVVSFGQSSTRIAGVDEPPELTGTPKKLTPPSNTLQQLSEIMQKWKEDDPETVKALRPQLDGFISQHPEFADGYAVRAMADACYIKNKNYESANRDINTAIAAPQQDQDSKMFPLRDLYAFRAKFDHEMGNDSEAMNDLERAMKQDLDSAVGIFNSGGTKPDANTGRCAWSLSEVDALVQKFPRDYRSTLFRALYLSFFKTFDEKYFQQAIQEFQKAAVLNPRSSLPHFFIGDLYVWSAFWTKAAMTSDTVRNEAHGKAVLAFTKAIELEPTLKEAYVQRANAYYQLKQSRQAVKDYDKVLQLDPENQGAYHDRALAKMDLGQYYSAISDFGDSIRRQKPDSSLFLKLAYENRADANMKVGDSRSAIADLDKAIERELANDSFLMNLQEFRTIYREYRQVSDEALVKKIQALFWPNFTYDVLSKQLLENKDFTSLGLADLYVKRGDAYLKAKDFRKAAAEYDRAFMGFGEYGKAAERWRLFTSSRGGDEFYLDVKTIEFSTNGPARLWLKSKSKNHTYTIDAYEVDCKAKRIDDVSSVAYDANDKFLRSTDLLGGWQRITPDTMGEELYDGLCSTNP